MLQLCKRISRSMLIIDNYDSFTYNLVQYFKLLNINPTVVKSDEKLPKNLEFSRIVISPGWGNPNNAQLSMKIIGNYAGKKPILGVCLGHQCIAQYFGASIVKSSEPMHGKVSKIYFTQHNSLYSDVKQGFKATRYHSLIIERESLPECLEITAETEDKIIMSIQHKTLPIVGVQFHPEAILTEFGLKILENFVKYY